MRIMPTRISVPFLGRKRESTAEVTTRETDPEDRNRNGSSRNRTDNSSEVNSSKIWPRYSSETTLAEAGSWRSTNFGAYNTLPRNILRKPTPLVADNQVVVQGMPLNGAAVSQRQRPWRKLLYIKQDYPDDYVDDTFLMELRKNTNVQIYDYYTIAMQTTVVTQHISSIMVFIAVFINLYHRSLTGEILLWSSSVFTILGFIFWDLMNSYLKTPEQQVIRLGLVKSVLFFTLVLFGLSPILSTLTEDTSSDTIWAMTVIFFLVNLAFHDYSSGNLSNIRFPGSVSLNAAIFAGVLLASRLDSNLSVFAFLSFALQWFALFPILRRYLKRVSPVATVAVTVILALFATVLFFYISRAIAMLHLLATLFITFSCPLWLIWIQRYKNEIHGPWDEARPIVHHYFH